MTLGDFRKITKRYSDDCELHYCPDSENSTHGKRVVEVFIQIHERQVGDKPPAPNIIVL